MQRAYFAPGLPVTGPDFVGRAAELEQLNDWYATGQTPLLLTGARGIGKTSLALVFMEDARMRTTRVSLRGSQSGYDLLGTTPPCVPAVDQVRNHLLNLDHEPDLVFIDDVEPGAVAGTESLFEWLTKNSGRAKVIAATSDPELAGKWRRLGMSPLRARELSALLGRLGPLDAGDAAALRFAIDGNPTLAHHLGQRVMEGASVDDVLELVEHVVWRRSNAEAVSRKAAASYLAVTEVGDDLIRTLALRPELLHELRPRRFEELVAELYARKGFDVELTAASKDGGVDLYVVRHEAFGRLLTVVDCKRYAAHNPVRVDVVRKLLGVVEIEKASAGVIATTSRFTKGASDLQRDYPFRLGLQDYFDLQVMLREAVSWHCD